MLATALISVKVKPNIVERLQLLARTVNRSNSDVVAAALEDYLDIQEWQLKAIQAGLDEVNNNEIVSLESVKQKFKNSLSTTSPI